MCDKKFNGKHKSDTKPLRNNLTCIFLIIATIYENLLSVKYVRFRKIDK